MNWQTLVTLLVIVVIFVSIVVRGIINRKNGKHSCSCGCDGCNLKDSCHK